MNNGLSARDLERVSAYLDDELSLDEKAAFEQRLKSEPALTRALAELRATKSLLQRAPKRRTPRSFAIRSEMVAGQRKSAFGGWTTLNLVSAGATLVLVLVFAGDLWANGLPLASLGAPAAEEAPQALMAQEPTAGDTALSATPTASPAEGAREIERFAVPENNLQPKEPLTDLTRFIAENARFLELVLVAVAILAGSLAWWRKRNP